MFSRKISPLITFAIVVCLVITVLLTLKFSFAHSTDNETQIKQAAQAILAKCDIASNKDTCYATYFTHITKAYSSDYSLLILHELKNEQAFPVGCHFIGHVIAGEEVSKNPDNWQEVMKRLPLNDCTGGFIMGAIEGLRKSNKNYAFTAQTIPQLCAQVQAIQTCVHTSGHLLLIETAGNVEKATDECSQLEPKYKYECYAGVFMENIFRRNLQAHGIGDTLEWSEETLKSQIILCNQQEEFIAQACWRELSHMAISLAKSNPEKVYALCSTAPEMRMQTECYLHAVSVMILSSAPNSTASASLCKPVANKLYYQQCLNIVNKTAKEIIQPQPTFL